MGPTHVAVGALATGSVQHNGAQRVGSTGSSDTAGVGATAVHAGQVSRAVRVRDTATS